MKIRCVFLVLAFLVNASCLCATTICVGELYFELNDVNKSATVDSITNRWPWNIDMTYGYYDDVTYQFGINIPSKVNYDGITYTVTSIGDKAFRYCHKLGSIIIPESVTSIGDSAFQSSGLTSITIPEGVTSIGTSVFQGTKLTSIDIPKRVTSIGKHAFESSRELGSITIPESVTSIGNYAFQYSGLTSITIPEGVTSIGTSAFQSCNSLTSIIIHGSATNIGDYVFSHCLSLTSVTISKGVISMGTGVFTNCTSLTSINLPEGLTHIPWYAFYECSNLTSITIPESVTNIGDYAFNKAGLEFIRCDAVIPPIIEGTQKTFNNQQPIPLYVPAESVDLYKKVEVWKRFFNILPIDEVISSVEEVRTTAKNKKFIRNGQVLIESGNKIYNTNGVEIR